MTSASDLVTLVVRAHEVVARVATDMDGFLESYGVAGGSVEIVAALSVVFVTWVLAAILIGGSLRVVWRIASHVADRGTTGDDGPEPERVQ